MKQENIITRWSGCYSLNFYEFSRKELQSFEQLLQNNPDITIEEPRIKNRTCYKKIMEIINFSLHYDYDQEIEVKELELLTAMVGKSLSVEAFNFKNIAVIPEHIKVLANLAKSKVLHTLCIGFENAFPGIAHTCAELINSNSLKTIYLKFSGDCWFRPADYQAVIKNLIKIPKLDALIIQLGSKSECSKFVNENNAAIKQMIADYSREKSHTSFQALLNIPEISLPIEIIRHITEDIHAKISSLEIEYSFDYADK
jgi:hypothetical protein